MDQQNFIENLLNLAKCETENNEIANKLMKKYILY